MGVPDQARGHAVWLVAVVAVVVGLFMLHSPMCADDSAPAAHAVTAMDGHDVPAPDGALMTCLVLVVSVLVAAAAPARPERGVPVRVRSAGARTCSNAVEARPPRLARLCVLRL